ncbi:MAG: insulinase family protein [Deltaproteobacteria bacterium]|nr:insulinase family protein [Deltaproteobacteria bacterium]
MVYKVGVMIALLTFCSAAFATGSWAQSFAQKTRLPNGLTLIVSERNQLPTIHLQVLIRAGSTLDPPNLLGLANLVSELLPQGTTQRDATQISRQIESVGGSISASAESDYATISLAILKKDLPLGLSILSDILLNPAFSPQEIERKVSALKARLKRMEEDPNQVAQLAFAKKLFGAHPYAHPKEGSVSTLSSMTREDIIRFFQSYYRPNNASLLMVGQITLQESSELIQHYLKDWKPAPIQRPSLVQPPALPGPVIEKIERPITQANIIWGHLGIARSNPDYYAIQVMNYILGGGGFVSRLVDIIRDNLGLTYGVSSYFDAREFPGSFQIAMETKSQNTNQALSEILKEMNRFLEKGISPAELSEAKAYLTGSFPFRMDTNAKLVRLLSAIEFYGLGLDFPDKYPQLINQVTADEVLRVARTYLKPEKFLLVVVGDQKQIQLKNAW